MCGEVRTGWPSSEPQPSAKTKFEYSIKDLRVENQAFETVVTAVESYCHCLCIKKSLICRLDVLGFFIALF